MDRTTHNLTLPAMDWPPQRPDRNIIQAARAHINILRILLVEPTC